MAKDNQFQHKVSALAKPRPNRADPLKDPAYHEPQFARERALNTRRSQADEVLRTESPMVTSSASRRCRRVIVAVPMREFSSAIGTAGKSRHAILDHGYGGKMGGIFGRDRERAEGLEVLRTDRNRLMRLGPNTRGFAGIPLICLETM